MGVELFTDDNARFSIKWELSHTGYGDFLLEIVPEPMDDHLWAGEPGGLVPLEVTGHPRWSRLVGRKLTRIDIAWFDNPERSTESDRESGGSPYAIRLCSRERRVWIVAAEERGPERTPYLGMDNIMVIFTAEFAAEIGIPTALTTLP
jgi:hypothetical protein